MMSHWSQPVGMASGVTTTTYHLLLLCQLDSLFSGFVEGTTKLTSPFVSFIPTPLQSFIWLLLILSVCCVCYCVERRAGCLWALGVELSLLAMGHHLGFLCYLFLDSTLPATDFFNSACPLFKSPFPEESFPLIHTVPPEATWSLYLTGPFGLFQTLMPDVPVPASLS